MVASQLKIRIVWSQNLNYWKRKQNVDIFKKGKKQKNGWWSLVELIKKSKFKNLTTCYVNNIREYQIAKRD